MGLMKGRPPAEEELYDMQPPPISAFKLFTIRISRKIITLGVGAAVLSTLLCGFMAILGNKISGNPFIPLTLYCAVNLVVFIFAKRFHDKKYGQYI